MLLCSSISVGEKGEGSSIFGRVSMDWTKTATIQARVFYSVAGLNGRSGFGFDRWLEWWAE